jgi:hypothetical protein
MGWIATALPGRVRSWLGLCLTMATHCDHATNMLITSQHVSIVERLADRNGPTSDEISQTRPCRDVDAVPRLQISRGRDGDLSRAPRKEKRATEPQNRLLIGRRRVTGLYGSKSSVDTAPSPNCLPIRGRLQRDSVGSQPVSTIGVQTDDAGTMGASDQRVPPGRPWDTEELSKSPAGIRLQSYCRRWGASPGCRKTTALRLAAVSNGTSSIEI